MPLYEYQCQGCGNLSEVMQRMSEPPLSTCEECGGELKKLISAPAFQFKGTGWYVTDYAGKGEAGKDEAGKDEAGKAKDEEKDTGSDDSKTKDSAKSGSSDSTKSSGSSDSTKTIGKTKSERVASST